MAHAKTVGIFVASVAGSLLVLALVDRFSGGMWSSTVNYAAGKA